MDCEKCRYYSNNGKDELCETRGWDFKRTDCPDFKDKSKPKTNADRIRSMTDEELAYMLVDIGECDRRCPAKIGDCIFSDSSCKSAWLDWLKQEVTT